MRGRNGRGSAYTHPSALDSVWGLKLGPPLLSCNLSYPSYLPCLLIGVPGNSRRWCQTWAGELLTVVAWMQVAVLSGYPLRAVLRATHSAVVRVLSTEPQDFNSTVRFMYYIAPRLPLPCCCAVFQCLQWLKKHAIWRGNNYSSLFPPTGLRRGTVSGAWCSDFPSLQEHIRLLVCLRTVTMQCCHRVMLTDRVAQQRRPCVCVSQRLRWTLVVLLSSCTCLNDVASLLYLCE